MTNQMTISRYKFVFFISLFLLIGNLSVFAQTSDGNSKPAKIYKNSIKYNVTNMLLYDNSYQFSCERIIKENQSINVVFGCQKFPLITLDLGIADLTKDNKRSGYSFGVDYRFYLGSINKYSAPRGVYLAPFVSFFQFNTERNMVYTNPDNGIQSNATLDTKLNLTNIGGELGYQFVLWKRFVVDCVLFGPSLTRYNFNVKLDGEIPGIEENELAQDVIEAIKNKFPNIGNLSGDEAVSKKGVQSITAVGFRYNISIGYRF